MALQIWLPLDGTLENKGCADAVITNNGATIDTAGKIGSCYSFDGSNDMISINCQKIYDILGGSQSFSMTIWVYRGDSTRAILFGDYKISPITDKNFVNLELSTDNHIYFYWGNGTGYDRKLDFSSVVLNQWSHIAVTYDGNFLKGYLNGELQQTVSANLYLIGKTSGEYRLGRDSRTGTTALKGKLNDFRLYDHCLSAAEVYEISQGLVLHYKLDGLNSGARENLLRTTPTTYNSSAYLAYRIPLTENFVKGETYTFQAWDINVSHSAKTEDTTGFGIWWGGPAVQLFTRLGTLYFNNGHTNHIAVTFTAPNSTHAHTENAWIEIYNSPYNADGTRSMSIGHWKIEKGNTPTGYAESLLDNEVTTITDSSGYGHHGTIKNVVDQSDDSPRYSCSINLPNGNSAINCGRGGMITDSITYSMWINYSTWGNPVSCTESGGWNFERNPVQLVINIESIGYLHAVSSFQPTANEWHMLTGVYDRLNQKAYIYIDGQMTGETNASSPNLIHYNGSNVIWLGAEASGSATAFASNGMIGKMSDFRIYCTALSAEDILDLYRTSAKIDKTGKVHTFEFVEDEGLKITKTGITRSNTFLQNGCLFNEGDGFSYKPTTTKNSCAPVNSKVYFDSVMDLGIPIKIAVDFDLTWENFAFQASPAGNIFLQTQGTNRRRSDGVFAWEGSNYATVYGLHNIVKESNSGTTHIHQVKTIPVSWFQTYDASNIGIRCDYSDGNGTITVSNIKITLASDITKFARSYISANEFIER